MLPPCPPLFLKRKCLPSFTCKRNTCRRKGKILFAFGDWKPTKAVIIGFIDFFFPPLVGNNTLFFSDCVQVVLCENYTAFFFLTHERAISLSLDVFSLSFAALLCHSLRHGFPDPLLHGAATLCV